MKKISITVGIVLLIIFLFSISFIKKENAKNSEVKEELHKSYSLIDSYFKSGQSHRQIKDLLNKIYFNLEQLESKANFYYFDNDNWFLSASTTSANSDYCLNNKGKTSDCKFDDVIITGSVADLDMIANPYKGPAKIEFIKGYSDVEVRVYSILPKKTSNGINYGDKVDLGISTKTDSFGNYEIELPVSLLNDSRYIKVYLPLNPFGYKLELKEWSGVMKYIDKYVYKIDSSFSNLGLN